MNPSVNPMTQNPPATRFSPPEDPAWIAHIEAAARRIEGYVRKTPVITLPSVPGLPDATQARLEETGLRFKLESLQVSGTFKARGAFNRLLSAREAQEAQAPAGAEAVARSHAPAVTRVVAASGGNHGIAVAMAAQRLGLIADIFVPQATPAAKLARLEACGARVHRGGRHYTEAYAASQAWAEQTGALTSHAFDQLETVAGQGTVAVEWQAQAPELDTVLVAVGGGGLIGGIAAWYGARAAAGARPVRVIGVETEGCPTLYEARRAGRITPIEVSGIAADSLGAPRLGEFAFAVSQQHVADSVLVPDAAVSQAQVWLWQHLRMAVEPGGATAFAALLSGRWQPARGERVGVLLCGANVELSQLSQLTQVTQPEPVLPATPTAPSS